MPSVPPVPDNEAERLARLWQYRILDTRPTDSFDRIARLASRLLQVPVATVSLLDSDRIWFKSKVGTEVSEVPRLHSFCAHTICGNGVLVIEQAHLDPRFAEYPFVADEPFFRFYAGVPLTSPDGYNVGTLSVMDYAEREFPAEARLLLKDLAKIVVDEMELHVLAQHEQEARNRLYDAIDAAPDGFVFYDADDRMILCNKRYLESYPESADLMVPGMTFEQVIREGVVRGQFEAAKDNEESWIAERMAAHRNPQEPFEQQLCSGRWMRIQERRTREGGVVGFRTDITELKEREFALAQMAEREQEARDRLLDAIEALPDGFVCYDAQDRLEMCNERYREIYALSADLMVPGARFEDILRGGIARGQYPAAAGKEEEFIQMRLAAHRKGKAPIQQELPDGRWIQVVERCTRDGGVVGFRTDITELKEREFALQRLATTDPLTGAMNRRRFLEAGESELRRAERYDAPP
jgi:PAS domain-containing protein